MKKIVLILALLAVLLCAATTVPPAQDDDGGGSVFLLKEYRTVYVYSSGTIGGWGLYCVGVDPVNGKPVLLGSLATSQADTLDHLRDAYDQQARAFEKPALYYNTVTRKFSD